MNTQYFSLHIGVSHIDETHYDNNLHPLPCCQRDMLAMKQLAITLNYDHVETLCNESATVANFKSKLHTYSQCLEAGDFLLITYSGHGGQMPLLKKLQCAQSNEKIETWCLYDRQLLDKELPQLWATFKAGVTIVLVMDSCHSGGGARGLSRNWVPKLVGRAAMQNIVKKGENTDKCNKTLYEELQRTYTNSSKKETVLVNFLHLAACKPNQLALAGPFMSKYTWELLKILGDHQCKSYVELQEQIKIRHEQLAHEGQIPVYQDALYGVKTSFFEENLPFVRKGETMSTSQQEALKALLKPVQAD